jgi:hypothetical protein
MRRGASDVYTLGLPGPISQRAGDDGDRVSERREVTGVDRGQPPVRARDHEAVGARVAVRYDAAHRRSRGGGWHQASGDDHQARNDRSRRKLHQIPF